MSEAILRDPAPERERRSGTETRRRSRLQVGVRLDAVEHEAITTLAEQAGMSMADYLRWSAIGKRARLRRSQESADDVRVRLLRELLGHVGRVGNNVNQIAKAANIAALTGQSVHAEVAALEDFQATVMAWKAELRGILGTRELEE